MQQSSKLSEVRALVAVAETGSFSAASKLLGRDPTVVSRSIQSLERRVGVRLVDRSTRLVTLTEAGNLYVARVRPLLQELDAADREASALASGDPRGRLKVSLPGAFGRLWLASAIAEFARAFPQVTLDLSYSNRFVDLISEGFDIALRLGELADSRLIARKVASRRRLLCASSRYLADYLPIQAPEDLAGHKGLIFTGRTDPYRWVLQNASGETRTVTVDAKIASDEADVLVSAAIAGLGIILTTDWHVGPALDDGRLMEVLPNWPVSDGGAIYIMVPAGPGLPSKTRVFSDWLAQELAIPPWTCSKTGVVSTLVTIAPPTAS